MSRRTLRASLCLVLLAVTAPVVDAGGGVGGGGGGGRGGGAVRRRAGKSAKGASQTAAILDGAIRRDNLRRSRQVDW